tara:strand:- start:2779 stop:4395 length:1617 start_codon:yes stop_codon:yes gene_type:complete
MPNEIKVTVNADTSKAKSKLQNFSDQARKVGLAFTAMGAAGTLAIKGFVNASMVQEQAVATLGAAVENTGVSFDSVKQKVMDTTAALQAKTNFGDEEQIKALATMVTIIGDVDKALEALPTVLDAASVSGLGMGSVAKSASKALSGLVQNSDSLGIVFDKNATFAERLAIMQGKAGGAAEANVNQFTQLNNAMGDLNETIGKSLLPALMPLVEFLTSVVVKLQTMNPTMLKVVTTIGLMATGFMVVTGPILLLLSLIPSITAGFAAITVASGVLMGVTGIGLLIAGVGALVFAWKKNFGGIQEKTEFVFGKLMDLWNGLKTAFFDKFGDTIDDLADKWSRLWNGIKSFTLKIFNELRGFFAKFVNSIVDKLNALIGMYNAVATRLGFDAIPTVEKMAESFKELVSNTKDSVQWFMRLGTERNKLAGGTGFHQLGTGDSRAADGGFMSGASIQIGRATSASAQEMSQQMAAGVLGRFGITADMYSRMSVAERRSAEAALTDFEQGAGNLVFFDGVAGSVDQTEGAEAVDVSALSAESFL